MEIWGIYFSLLAIASRLLWLFVRAAHADWILLTLFVLQVILMSIISLGDIGFDHGGRYGLDFGDFIRLLWLYGAALTFGLVIATKFQKYVWVGAQLSPLAVGCLLAGL